MLGWGRGAATDARSGLGWGGGEAAAALGSGEPLPPAPEGPGPRAGGGGASWAQRSQSWGWNLLDHAEGGESDRSAGTGSRLGLTSEKQTGKEKRPGAGCADWRCAGQGKARRAGTVASTPAQDGLSCPAERGASVIPCSLPGPAATTTPRPEKQRPSEASSRRGGPNLAPPPPPAPPDLDSSGARTG